MKRFMLVLLMALCASSVLAQDRLYPSSARRPQVSRINRLKVYIDFNRIEMRGVANQAIVRHLVRDVCEELDLDETLDPNSADIIVTGSVIDELQRQDREGGRGRVQANNPFSPRKRGIEGVLGRIFPSTLDLDGSSSHTLWTIYGSIDIVFATRGSQGQSDRVLVRKRGAASKQGVQSSDKELRASYGRFFNASDLVLFQSSNQEESFMALATIALALDHSHTRETATERQSIESFPVTQVLGNDVIATVTSTCAGRLYEGQTLSLTMPQRERGEVIGGAEIGKAVVRRISGRIVTLSAVNYRGPYIKDGPCSNLAIEVPAAIDNAHSRSAKRDE